MIIVKKPSFSSKSTMSHIFWRTENFRAFVSPKGLYGTKIMVFKVSSLNRWGERAMRIWNRSLGWLVSVLMAGLVMLSGCDSGEKALDEVTGNRAVKQYHKSKKDIEKVAEQQSERLKSIPDDEKQEGKRE